jgi:hypothetical protein
MYQNVKYGQRVNCDVIINQSVTLEDFGCSVQFFGLFAHQNVLIICLFNLYTFSASDEGYSRSGVYYMRYLRFYYNDLLWTINPPRYHQPSNQCFGTDMVY